MATAPVIPLLQPGQPKAAGTNIPAAIPTSSAVNPYAPPVAGSGAIPGAVAQGTNGINWNDGSKTIVGDFKDTYGAGTGVAITDVLKNLGGTNSEAVKALIQNTGLAADKQYANIQAQQAAAGITPNSSAASLAAGDFYSSVNSNLQTEIAGMELSEEDTLLKTLLGEGQAHGPDTSGWDTFTNVLSSVGGVVGDAAGAFIGDPKLGSQLEGILHPNSGAKAQTPTGESGPLFGGGANELDLNAAGF